MSSGARIGLVVTTLVVLVLAFVLLSPDAEESRTATAPAATTEAPTTSAPSAAPASPRPPPAPEFESVRVTASKPVGGVKTITVSKGDRARIQVSSKDTTDEVHLHGYDVTRDLRPGGRVRFSFVADAEGIFELELEGAHTQIAKLVVEP